MFLPAGALMSFHAVLALAGVATIYRNNPGWTPSQVLQWQVGMLILGIGITGFGLTVLTGDHVYRALGAPAIAMLGLVCLRQAVRGRRTGWLARTERNNVLAYAGCWMFGLVWPVFVAWSFGLIRLSSK